MFSYENNNNIVYHADNENTKNPSKRYCLHIGKIFRGNKGIMHKYIYPNHNVVCIIRKESSTHTTTHTTCLSPILSVA